MGEEFTLIKDFVGDDGQFYLDTDERVKVLKTDEVDPTLLLVQICGQPSRTGLVPMDYLKKVPPSRSHTPDSLGHGQKSRKQEAKFNREVCIAELIDTEEEFGRDIQMVVDKYLNPLEEETRPAPRTVMDNKDTIFQNLKQIAAFHNGIMISGVKYFQKEPRTIGRTFLRLERDFDKHAEYVRNEPVAEELLYTNDEIRDYFEDLSREIGDDKLLFDHLKLPIQRINDYTLLLQELIKYSRILGEDITDLERALELMLWIPTRCIDIKYITNIEGYHGNMHKLGRLLRHNWFLVKDKDNTKGMERYVFLFKARLLICKVRRISEDRCVFVLKEIVKLPDVDIKNRSDKRTFEIHSTDRANKNYPLTLVAHEDDVKADWFKEIQLHAEDDLTQAEHIADDLKVHGQSDDDLFEPLKGIELEIPPDIEENLDPIERYLGHKPLKHVPEPRRPPLEAPRKRTPIFTCVDPTPSPSPEPEPEEPEPEEPEDELGGMSSDDLEEPIEEPEPEDDGIEELVEMPSSGKRRPVKYKPGVSKPLFHSPIKGSNSEPGQSAVFECDVEGATKVTWLKDNRPLSERLSDRVTMTEENQKYRLEIRNCTELDSGTYTAKAENDCGVSYSTAHLVVEKLSDEEKRAQAKATSPVFLVQLKDADLLEGTHARFMVRVNGNPMPKLEFYKGDRLINDDDERVKIIQDKDHAGFYEMIIADVQVEDAGEYRCIASNKYSDECCSCIVNVKNEKDLSSGLDDELQGGLPRFSWLKNGRPFIPEERFKVVYKDDEDSIALVFHYVTPEDAGFYTCIASTVRGKITCSAELTVQGVVKELEKPLQKAKIECSTRDFDGNVASTGVIEVRAIGDPLPTIRWFRDGEEITSVGRYKVIYDEETETASLVIKNLNLEDTGEYNVLAKNTLGSDSQFINLKVKAPPRILKKLFDFTGLTNRELKLTVEISASPKPIVHWYKNGLFLKPSSRIKYVVDESTDSYTLAIDNAVMDDAGTYSVVASNEYSQDSDACHVTMESPPQFLAAIAKEVETVEGDYVSFSVLVDGDPLPDVKWKFNGTEIKHDGNHFKMSSDDSVFTMLISEVKREDAGLYSCEISNQWGGNQCDGHLYVKCLPRFDQDIQDFHVNDLDVDVELAVKVNSFPSSTITWYQNNNEITLKRKDLTLIEEGDTHRVIIKQATTRLAGIYKCVAENEVGIKETCAKLSVHTFPKFKKELEDIEIIEKDTFKVTVACDGVPEPEVVWYHNDEEIYSDDRIKMSRDAKKPENYNLTVHNLQSDDTGEYQVRATNVRGTAITKCTLTVLEFPRILSGMTDDIDTYESLCANFQVQGYGVPRPSILWFKDGDQLDASKHYVMTEEDDVYKIEIVDLKSTDAGEYTAKLINKVGEATRVARLNVSDVENLRGPKLQEPLKDAIVVKRQSATLQGTFVADPVPDAKWIVDDRDVNADFSVDVKELDLGLKECTYTMLIPSTDLSDAGTYKLKVKNKFEAAESSATLTILMKPEIESFKDIVVPPTMPCTFEAVVMSIPDATAIWLFNEKQIEPSEGKHKIVFEKLDTHKTVFRLSLEDCALSDEGVYKIVAANDVGKCEGTASLKLYTEEPSFVKLLEDRSVQDFDFLQMKVRINGLPKPAIKWYRNGEEITEDQRVMIEISDEGQMSSSLSIEHFTENDVAEYKVTISNIVGEAETKAKLTLAHIEPSFTESFKRVTEIAEGEALDIRTTVIGSPRPRIKWFKDGEEINPDHNRIKNSVNSNGLVRLCIDRVDVSDCGAYKVVATNDLGKSIANTAVVVNQVSKKPTFVRKLEDTTVVEGEPIILRIQIDGYPEPTVKWLKDGHALHPCPQMDFISGPNGTYGLSIEKATLQDLGQYFVIISNRCGDENNSAYVDVMPADKMPVFRTQLQSTKVVEGYPAKLEVKVDGFPPPILTWYFNGNAVNVDGNNVKLGTTPEGNHCLLIEKCNSLNSGEYEVVAKNDIGDTSTKAYLTVSSRSNPEMEHEKPIFLHGLRDVTEEESGTLSINAPFRGNPIPDVQWLKDGNLLLPNERIHFTCDGYKIGLEIKDVNMGDTGFYSCTLRNLYGQDSSAAHVGVRKLYQAPVFTQRFRHIQQLPKHNAKFHCRVTGLPFPSVIWHFMGSPISNSDKHQIKRDGDICCLTVFNVSHRDEGTYSCIASNREGTATCEAQLRVDEKIDTAPKQEPPQFLKKIGDCEIYAGMTAKFTACAIGYPEPEYEWFCDTIRLHPSNRFEMEKESSGLVRLKILTANPDMDTGRYRLRAFNVHGEAFCEANIIFDKGLESKHKRPLGEQYKDYDRFRATGAPLPLANKPIISRMTDNGLTLLWKCSLPIGPREPVTYLVEMEEQPNGKWLIERAGIRSCVCDIHNLKPFVDYKFRVRVENNYGISDPSPFAMTQRENLQPDPPKIRTYLPPNVPFHPDTSCYFPKDFDIERPPHDNYAQAPRFLRQEHGTQYGVKGHNVNLLWFVFGYPKPKISFYFDDQLIQIGGRYDYRYTRNGIVTLFINKMTNNDVGIYEAVAVNEHGTARQRVRLLIAEYPRFLKIPDETYVPVQKMCKLEVKVVGIPYPEIIWYKDWRPLAPSSRIQIEQIEPDLCILRISEAAIKDEGLYSIGARNIAGSVSASAYVHIAENDRDLIVGVKKGVVLIRNKKLQDVYDLGDELGRGTQGVVYHVVERNTGKNLAAKIMYGGDELKKCMTYELDIMNHLNHPNLIRAYDCLLSSKSFAIIQELGSGGELLDVLTHKPYTSEYEISNYIRQLLLGLDYMHDFNIGHLGLTPGELLISHPRGDTLKLCDFGLSRRINTRKLEPLLYGMPEFVAPEVANGEGVGLSVDMWSVGVITHLLLTGVSLFKGHDDADTLDRVKSGQFTIDTEISPDARDFIIKLLMMNANNRMDVRTALNHRWITSNTGIDIIDEKKIDTENLRNYYNAYKDWFCNSSCRTWFRRRSLESAYGDLSGMIYPSGCNFTPEPSPPPQNDDENQERKSWRDLIPSQDSPDTDSVPVKSESHYQYGPDTYLLPLRDVAFPVRLREYMKVAKKTTTEGFDWQTPAIRERRRFVEIMDEEIDEEQKARISETGSVDIHTLRRLKQEVGVRPTAHVEAEAILGSRIDGLPPFFREKPQTIPVEIEKPTELICYAVGSPKPAVQWFRNDVVVTECHRAKITEDNEGRSILRLNPVTELDLGIYKVVARNKFGQTTARARLVLASEPCPPEPPEIVDVSDTEVLLKWKQPRHDGNSAVLCYGLEVQENDDGNWKKVAENIDHEAWLVHHLKSCTEYQFRLLAMNKIGWSRPGFHTQTVKTKIGGCPKIRVPHVLLNMQIVCENGKEIIGEEPRITPDYSLEYKCLEWKEQPPQEKYRFISEITRGRFSVIVKGIDSSSGNLVVAKAIETVTQHESNVDREFNALKTMRHERIAYLIEAFKLQNTSIAIFIMEKLQGADILAYLTSRETYSEQMIVTVITQVLDALQYLHWRGYCHLDLQPDNVVMASARSLQIKLVDFGCAQRVNRLGTVVPHNGCIEYAAPELLCDEPAYPFSDIWSLGVLTYILLSGVSPFKGFSDLETRQNITFVRYRFEHLYKGLSQEALRFIMLLFKRTPSKRPSAEDCHEHRWLLPTEYMINKRERTIFETTKLKSFSDNYHSKRDGKATKSKEFLTVLGNQVNRSNSIAEELFATNILR